MLSSADFETPKSQFCCLLGGTVTAAAAPARADALIVHLLVLTTHIVRRGGASNAAYLDESSLQKYHGSLPVIYMPISVVNVETRSSSMRT